MKNLFAKHFAVLSLLFLWGCSNTHQDQTPPNIIWIVSEDNSPLLGCYGDSLAISPNIDKLAKEGILYENAFANAPVCAPSRATLITGMYPTTLGTQNMRCMVELPKSVKFFPQYLRDAGYFTSLRIKRDYNSP
ncbi:MAG: sulfatase-like hydrolase/transferase, partial [Flavobacteriales bacterium]|nr:sulfatase-like hydrolase/transferase [Flavobacteriales bacterium]